MSDLIRRSGAIEAVCEECEWERKCHEECQHIETLKSLPSAETVDCTDFVLWLLDEIMDEENWELNAVANGEIIARKLKKLGLLKVKDGYYVRTPSAEAVTGEWIQKDMYADRFCSKCNYTVWDSEAEEYNFCPNCGAKMKGGEDE